MVPFRSGCGQQALWTQASLSRFSDGSLAGPICSLISGAWFGILAHQ